MKNSIGGTLLFIACALIGALLANAGAKSAGMQTAMSFEPLIHLVIGFGVAAFAFLVLILVNQRAVVAALGALILAFLAGLVGHYIIQYFYDSNSDWMRAKEAERMRNKETEHVVGGNGG